MSRIRSVHPGLWTDEEFVTLTPFARLLFMGIWNECDDQGVFEWKPVTLKMRLLPADNIDATALLDELKAIGSVVRYEVNGKSYGAVRNFCKFQRPKKPNAVHPVTAEIRAFCGKGSEPKDGEEPEVPNELPTSGEIPPQMEDGGGKREEEEPNGSPSSAPEPTKPKRSKRSVGVDHLLPADWSPTLTPAAINLTAQWPPGMLEREEFTFRNHAEANGRLAKDWDAAFRTWLGKADERLKQNGNGQANRSPSAGYRGADRRDGFQRALDRAGGFDQSGQPASPAGQPDAGDGADDLFLTGPG